MNGVLSAAVELKASSQPFLGIFNKEKEQLSCVQRCEQL